MTSIIKTIAIIIDFLAGKKTYIIGISMIAVGYQTQNNQLILEGLSVMTLRAGISKLE